MRTADEVLHGIDLTGRTVVVTGGYSGVGLAPLQRHLTIAEMTEAGWLGTDGEPVPGLFRTPEQGAATPLWAATAATRGGAYCTDCRENDRIRTTTSRLHGCGGTRPS